MRVSTAPSQRRISRSVRFFVVPVVLEVLVIAVLAWEIVRVNLSPEKLATMSFAPATLGIAPAAGIAGVLGALILARSQFSMTNRPFLAGHSDGWNDEHSPTWGVTIYNAGGGIAVVKTVRYRYQLAGESPVTRWLTFDELATMLRRD